MKLKSLKTLALIAILSIAAQASLYACPMHGADKGDKTAEQVEQV